MRHDNARTGTVRLEETSRAGESTPDDPRRRLCNSKYFGLRPQPLERYLYRLNLPRSAERVFWLHWDAGNRNGNFCSQLAISQVARECCLDESSVTRAYRTLKDRGLLRRQDPGRDPSNPFSQATALTEVLLPRDALAALLGAPNRRRPERPIADPQRGANDAERPRLEATHPLATLPGDPAPPPIVHAPAPLATEPPPPKRGDMKLALRALAKLTPDERRRYAAFRHDDTESMHWEEGSALTADERGLLTNAVLRARHDRAQARAAASTPSSPLPLAERRSPPSRLLNAFCVAYLRKKLTETAPLNEVPDRLREITWSLEQGALARLEVRLAMNVALKKLREGQWSRPHRMPPNWQLGPRT